MTKLRVMNTQPLVRPILAGALAGASGVAALALITVVWLGIGLAWQYAFYSSVPVIKDLALPAVIQDINRVPEFLWSWRWAMLALAFLGVPLAILDHLAQRYSSPLRERLAGIVLLAIVGAAVIAGLLIQTDQSLYADLARMRQESLARTREMQAPVGNVLLIGAVVSLAVAGGIWFYWSWWYTHWRRWMRLETGQVAAPGPDVAPEAWFARRHWRERLQLGAALSLLGSLLLATGAIAGYASARTVIQSGEVWPTAEMPVAEARLALTRPTRALVIENTFGNGTALVTVVRDGAVVAGPAEVAFIDGQLGFDRIQLPIESVPAGELLVRAETRSGAGGRVGYALLQSDGTLVVLTAILAGIGVGVSCSIAILLLGTIPFQRSSGE